MEIAAETQSDVEADVPLDAAAGADEGGQVPKELPSIDTIQKCIEELLSKHNLADDAFLLQHMNAQMYIPLIVLVAHHNLRSLGDMEIPLAAVKEAAQRSDKVGLNEDGTLIRPLLKPRRNTLILRDLPDTFPEEELRALFSGSPEGEAFVNLKPDVNNTAFATFKTDEAAQNVALWLRSQKLQGSEIKCAVKSEHFVRSFFPASPGLTMQASPYMSPQMWGYPAWTNGHMVWSDAGGAWIFDGSYPADAKAAAKGDGKKNKGSPKGTGKGRKRSSNSFSLPDANIEALPPAEVPQDISSPLQQVQVQDSVEPGYAHEYRKISRQYIIDICNAMDNIEKPESYEKLEENGVPLFRDSPNKEWAPLPTPMQAFASQVQNEGEQAMEASSSQRKQSWGPKTSKRTSRSRSIDNTDETEWSQGDAFWWTSSGRSTSNKRSSSKRNSNSWGGSYSQGNGPHWVKKESKAEQESEQEDQGSIPFKPSSSWTDKGKSTEHVDRQPRWVEKAKVAQEVRQDADLPEGQATDPHAMPATCKNAEKSSGAAPEADEDATAPPSPTWADKVRHGSSSK